MKNIVIGFFMTIILVFSVVAIQTNENSSTRKNELEISLGAAMKQSMEILTIDPTYHIEKEKGDEEFTADFIQGFLVNTTSDSSYEIKILKVDVEKGLLDVRVTEYFKQILGTGEITCRKTIILEEENKVEKEYFTISFDGQDDMGERITLKQVCVVEGDKMHANMLPKTGVEKKGMRFCGWQLKKPENTMNILYGEHNIEALYITDDLRFEAVYEKEGAI